MKDTVSVYNGKAVLPEKELIGNEKSVTYTYYSDAECTKAMSKAPVDAGTYYVIASVAEDQNYLTSVSNPAKLVIEKKAATIKAKDSSLSKTYKIAKTKKAAQKFTLSASVDSKGKLTYNKVSGHKSLKISKTGKITFAKTAKKGTYKMKVKITSAAKTGLIKFFRCQNMTGDREETAKGDSQGKQVLK